MMPNFLPLGEGFAWASHSASGETVDFRWRWRASQDAGTVWQTLPVGETPTQSDEGTIRSTVRASPDHLVEFRDCADGAQLRSAIEPMLCLLTLTSRVFGGQFCRPARHRSGYYGLRVGDNCGPAFTSRPTIMPEFSAAVSSRRATSLRTTGPTELPPPLGAWQPLRLVSETALAEVYQARPTADTADDAGCYALKLLKPEWAEDAGARELVRREVQAGRDVSHPHVISILDWSLSQSPHFLVMPLLTGVTLQETLARGPLSLSEALWVARQTAQGLEGLHSAGWMHADVKPANIFVAEDGHVTLLDLGFARAAGQTGSAADRPVVGTLAYMAPELLVSALAADIRSDIYSLGITLYQMLSGRLPFESTNPLQLAKEHRESMPDRLRVLNPQLPLEVEQLVRQMLAKEPLRRPQTPGEVVARLVALEIETLAERIPA